jgi:hypothetical protein
MAFLDQIEDWALRHDLPPVYDYLINTIPTRQPVQSTGPVTKRSGGCVIRLTKSVPTVRRLPDT